MEILFYGERPGVTRDDPKWRGYRDVQIDTAWFEETVAASSQGYPWSLFEYALMDTPWKAVYTVPSSREVRRFIYRGWMLSVEDYKALYEILYHKGSPDVRSSLGAKLVNSPEQYQHCHYLPESYSVIEGKTPKSVWLETGASTEEIMEALKTFEGKPVIIKDYVKSLKHYWDEACFIPDSSDAEAVEKVVSRFKEIREDVVGGLVFREFVEFEPIGTHSKSGMPLSVEYRLFYLDGNLMASYPYWDEGDYGDHELPPVEEFAEIAKKVNSNFFSMDVGKLKTGEWIIVELGDGQVTGLPDNADLDEFYKALGNEP